VKTKMELIIWGSDVNIYAKHFIRMVSGFIHQLKMSMLSKSTVVRR